MQMTGFLFRVRVILRPYPQQEKKKRRRGGEGGTGKEGGKGQEAVQLTPQTRSNLRGWEQGAREVTEEGRWQKTRLCSPTVRRPRLTHSPRVPSRDQALSKGSTKFPIYKMNEQNRHSPKPRNNPSCFQFCLWVKTSGTSQLYISIILTNSRELRIKSCSPLGATTIIAWPRYWRVTAVIYLFLLKYLFILWK